MKKVLFNGMYNAGWKRKEVARMKEEIELFEMQDNAKITSANVEPDTVEVKMSNGIKIVQKKEL